MSHSHTDVDTVDLAILLSRAAAGLQKAERCLVDAFAAHGEARRELDAALLTLKHRTDTQGGDG